MHIVTSSLHLEKKGGQGVAHKLYIWLVGNTNIAAQGLLEFLTCLGQRGNYLCPQRVI
jgi:hypothetical protein